MLKTSVILFVAASAMAQNQTAVDQPAIPNTGSKLQELSRRLNRDLSRQMEQLQSLTAVVNSRLGEEINSGGVTLATGVKIRYHFLASPDKSSLKLMATGISAQGDRMHRFVVDKDSQSYFGYDLIVSPLAGTDRYQAEFQPLTDTGMAAKVSGLSSVKPTLLPKYPSPQTVKWGDTIVLDLMVSEDGRRKITDYIEILPPPTAALLDPGESATDFTVDDGMVTLLQMDQHVWVNGQKSDVNGFTGKPGATFWLAIPGKGRYILSLTPHNGFLKQGVARGELVSFSDEGQQYALQFGGPITASTNAWNLYVYRDSSYQPRAGMKDMIAAGTDRLENLLVQ